MKNTRNNTELGVITFVGTLAMIVGGIIMDAFAIWMLEDIGILYGMHYDTSGNLIPEAQIAVTAFVYGIYRLENIVEEMRL